MKGVKVTLTVVFLVSIFKDAALSDISFTVSKWDVSLPTNSTFLALVNISVDQCVYECTSRPHCHVIGYKHTLNYCELHTKSNTSEISDHRCFLIYRKDMKGKQECNCGDWKVCRAGGSPPCTIKECPPPAPLQHGAYLGNCNYIGARKRARCHYGYRKKAGFNVIECLKTGDWNQTITCIQVDCGELPSIKNGSLTLNTSGHTRFGAMATVTCNTGYKASVGNISCTASAEWQTASCDLVCPSKDGNLTLTDTYRVQFNKTTNENQSQANATCVESGMKGLLRLDESWKREIMFQVSRNCRRYSRNRYWIDGTRQTSTVVNWQFSDGINLPMDGPILWQSGRPKTNLEFPRCLTIVNGKWFDRKCDRYHRFICEN